MKKIILMLVMLLPINVLGSVHYTEYEFKERTDKLYAESDTLKRKEIKLYHNIKKDITYNYEEDGHCEGKINEEDYKIKRIYNDNYYEGYDALTNLKESDYQKVRYIFIYDYDMQEDISDIEVYSNGTQIDFEYIDNVYDSFSGKNAYLVVDLKKIYNFQGLSLNIIFDKAIELDNENFTLFFSYINYTVPLKDIYINNFYVKKGISDMTIEVIPDDEYHKLLNELKFRFPNKDAINYLHKDIYYFGCTIEKIINTEIYTETPKEGFELDYKNYKIVYDYYNREKYETLEIIKTKDDIYNLVKGNVTVTNSNIDLSKNGIYEYFIGNKKHNVKVDIEENNKLNLTTNEPSIKEKIIYKVINNQKDNKNNTNNQKSTVNNVQQSENYNKCKPQQCEKCSSCNYKIYKRIIILLCVIILYLLGKNRYILTKGYKL